VLILKRVALMMGSKVRGIAVYLFLFVVAYYAAGIVVAQETFNDGLAHYRLSSGDKLYIQVFNEKDLSLDVWLGDKAVISYPFLGDIQAAGLTVKELENYITRGLRGDYLVDPKVTVSILQYRPFFVNGEVNKAGSYSYQPGLTLRKAIALAGGFTEQASIEEITTIHENAPSKPQLISLDAPLQPGDIVSVPVYSQVFVNGEVKKPGSYPFTLGLTLRKAIALAGGFTTRASEKKISVIHNDDPQKKVHGYALDSVVQPGDIITIGQSFF